MPDCVAIVSGGLDSVTLLHHLVRTEGRQPVVMSFLYGQKHAREIACAQTQAARLGCAPPVVADLTGLQAVFSGSALVDAAVAVPDMASVTGDPQPVTYVPNRNMIFLALAVALAESLGVDAVYYGAQRHDLYGYWDTTPDFLDRLNQVYALNRRTPVRIAAPFVDYSKADILRLGLALGVDYGQTWSCYQGADKACGRCPTCAERLAAFAEVGLTDPLPYSL
jgi:7-cyano-7-deazaguanine synthase